MKNENKAKGNPDKNGSLNRIPVNLEKQSHPTNFTFLLLSKLRTTFKKVENGSYETIFKEAG